MNPSDFSEARLAGQRLMAGFNGTRLTPYLKHLIGEICVGGIILFARNIESPGQLSLLCRSVQAYAADCGQPPLFIAIDQEGGTVARLPSPFTRFPGAPMMRTPEDAVRFAAVTSWELSAFGVNMNMAPVLDIAPKTMKSIMAKRAFSHDPKTVGKLGGAMIEEFRRNGIISVAKHFPGIGRTVLDSHHQLPVMPASPESLEAFDLIPFRNAIENSVPCVMLSHILYRELDPRWPASLSPLIAGDLLRRRLKFNGVAVTDDLDMGAVCGRYGFSEIIRQILLAEIDIILICHQGPDLDTAFREVRKRMETESLFRKCEDSVERIMNLKRAYPLSV